MFLNQTRSIRLHHKIAFLALTLLLAFQFGYSKPKVELTLSVAASLTESMQEVEAAYQKSHPEYSFRNNFGSSGALSKQIQNGAPVDILFSAAAKPIDDLQAKGLIVTRRTILKNSLVLVTAQGSSIKKLSDLTAPTVKKIALGEPASVPAGQYGLETLKSAKLDAAVKDKLVLAKDVRQVLTYVETGNAEAGFVYATDALTSHKVRVAFIAPESMHEPILYPAAVIAHGSHEPEAKAFLDFLSSPTALKIFAKHGFSVAK